MDLNLVVVSGRLATLPELRTFQSGSRLLRLLITVRSDEPRRRVDVLPVTVWDPAEELLSEELTPGRRVWVAGATQRRFWTNESGKRSRIEIVANHVEVPEEPDSETS
ncbi:MAG: single-stranded DNA-binding protein [Acidimicrobiia bacterium]|nr:single-stranded DNA-binding protein [Acidimicrobiia bacterium]MBT8215068.1 single-stranded DNA-binding protein [Acidimicrobiia bacterium]NNF70495.1 single-stranded DNA-binding protein [Acidimicrobiia bacterium]